MNTLKEYSLILLTILILLCSITILDSKLISVFCNSAFSASNPPTVVIDAGHGGFDPGKLGVDGTLEKEVNLRIAKKLEQLLKNADVRVIMTRTDDSIASSKHQDMENRADLMNKTRAHCIVSIHQNSYHEEAVQGAQVFYYSGSEQGKQLAALLQKELIRSVDPTNHRKEKANSSYYLFKKANAPIVIVECGFLSNSAECKKLVDDTYQQKLVWAIHLGILQYLNETRPEKTL